MLAKGYMSGQLFGQTPNYPFSKFANLSQFRENALNRYPTNDLTSLSDWRKNPRISCFRDLVREKIAESFELEENHQVQERESNLVNVLENKLFAEAASEEEYMNLDVLRERLQNLFQKNIVDLNCSQQVSSYSDPTHEVLPTLGLTQSCNSDAIYPPYDHFNNDITGYDPMVAGRNDQFCFLKGFLDHGNKLGVASINCDSHMWQISNELVLSHERSSVKTASSERGSTITTSSSGDKYSEIGAFKVGPFFSKGDCQYSQEVSSKDSFQQHNLPHGVSNDLGFPAMAFSPTLRESSEFPGSGFQMLEHVPQLNSEETIFPSMDFSISSIAFCMGNSTLDNIVQPKSHIQEQKHYASYEQFNKPLEMSGKIVPIDSHFPSEQLDGVQNASESSSLLSSSNGIAGPEYPSDHLKFSAEQKILRAYSSWKSPASPASPADEYNNSKCHQSSQNMYHDLLMGSSNTGTGGSGSCLSENMLPPTKRLKPSSVCSEKLLPPSKAQKIETSSGLLSSESGIVSISSILAPLMVQPPFPKGLPALLQLPESPVSINSEVLAGNIGFSKPMQNHSSVDQIEYSEPVQNPSSLDQIRNSAGDNFLRMNVESLHTPSEEPIIRPRSQEMDSSSFGEIADAVKDKSDKLCFNSSPALSDELGATEEVIQVMSNFDHAKPDLETRKEEEMKQDKPKIQGVSLIDFFSTDEIKDHISSLQQWIGKKMSKGEKEKQVMHCANDNTCQLCTADKLLLAPVPIYCSCCGSRIKCSVNYYSTAEENGMQYCFCTSCYRDSRGGSITFFGITILKAKLVKKKNDEEIEESWVQCDKCKYWQHQICALFNDIRDMEGKSEYMCPKCCLDERERGEPLPLPRAAVFSAKDLPTTLLSDYIEQRLLRRLQQEKEERAKALGKHLDEVPGADHLVVRVVLSVDKKLKVKQQFLETFDDGNYPNEFPYRSKVILLFQKIEGVDVCLFGMYVQEYGSECSRPNHRCVYISYLDSVKYFRPDTETAAGEALRTVVYHEILIGYLEFCKKRGFVACYLWACPPLKGEDYILYCHPDIQKTPKSDKLRQWYHSMLRKAAKENIVVDFTNLYDQFFVPTGHLYCKITAARLPYFDGDYWSGAAENIIKNIEQQNGEYSGRRVKKVMTKRTLKALGHTNPSGGVTKDIILMQKLGQTIFPFKEDFIVVHLQFVCSYCHEVIFYGWRWCCNHCKNFQLCERCHDAEQGLNGGETHAISSKEKHLLTKVMVDNIPSDIKDEDVILDNWLFENRHTLLGFCHKNHYQFDALRRAKHSSMMILHHLHNPTIPTTGTTCQICQLDTDTMDRNVCSTCYNKKFGSLHIRKSTYHYYAANCENESISAQQKMLKLKELLDVLLHASRCEATSSDPCSYPNCLQMKRLFCHASKCPIRFSRGCVHCKKVWYILKLHARNCEQTDCCVPRCRDLKIRREVLALQSETYGKRQLQEHSANTRI